MGRPMEGGASERRQVQILNSKVEEDEGKLASLAARRRPQAPAVNRGYVISIWVLAGLAVIFTLKLAEEVFVPLILSVLISYTLGPIVTWLQRWRIPRVIGAGLVLISIVAALAYTSFTLRDDVTLFVEQLPANAQRLRESFEKGFLGGDWTIGKITKAAQEISQADPSSAPEGAARTPTFSFRDYLDYLWWGSAGVVALGTELVAIFFLVYFLLISDGLFKQKLAKILASRAGKRNLTEILGQINTQIQQYLLVLLATGLMVAVLTGIAFHFIGVQYAAVWGVIAGVFNLIPYLGPIFVFVGVIIASLLQFGTLEMTVLVAGVSLLITSVEGFLLLPWLTGKAARMNSVAVFVGLLFGSWLWGPWGLLLATPVLMVVKTVSDHFDELRPVGEMLGE